MLGGPVLPASNDRDFAWLAGELDMVLRSGIAACEAATKLKARGPVGGQDRGGRFSLTEG